MIFVPVDDGTTCCAFLDTVTDRFVEDIDGCHTFSAITDLYEAFELDFAKRLAGLVPEGYFQRPSTYFDADDRNETGRSS